MNPELKREWIEALRSGKYTQGKRTFKNTDGGYCCLGVLCMVLGKPEYIRSHSYIGSDDYMALKADSGLSSDCARVLAGMNDAPSSSFNQIADYIEVNL